jgi:hypothetical protein
MEADMDRTLGRRSKPAASQVQEKRKKEKKYKKIKMQILLISLADSRACFVKKKNTYS